MVNNVVWNVLHEGSFASLRVYLPPRSQVHCESDAVVTMSESVDVRGVVRGGLFAGIARMFLTSESFFTTMVENNSREAVGDALLAPSEPGSVVLHQLLPRQDMMLTSGAYLAGDESVDVSSVLQSKLNNSLLSGTGFFLLRASGSGTIAFAAYGAIHKYNLRVGEKRKVDNGHLVAWTASMDYRIGLASRNAGIQGSLTSGEGLMCEFHGPGTIYLQSHKKEPEAKSKRQNDRSSSASTCGSIVLLCMIVFVYLFSWFIGEAKVTYSTSNFNNMNNKRNRRYDEYDRVRDGGYNEGYYAGEM